MRASSIVHIGGSRSGPGRALTDGCCCEAHGGAVWRHAAKLPMYAPHPCQAAGKPMALEWSFASAAAWRFEPTSSTCEQDWNFCGVLTSTASGTSPNWTDLIDALPLEAHCKGLYQPDLVVADCHPFMLCRLSRSFRSQHLTSAATRQLAYAGIRPLATRGRPRITDMKRKEAPSDVKSPSKKPKPHVPEYHETPSIKEEDGSIQWPAPKEQMEKARKIIMEWYILLYSKAILLQPTYILTAQKRTRKH